MTEPFPFGDFDDDDVDDIPDLSDEEWGKVVSLEEQMHKVRLISNHDERKAAAKLLVAELNGDS